MGTSGSSSEQYYNPTARYVYVRMCSYHRGLNLRHECKNEQACARAGRLAAWLEGMIEESEEWFVMNLNYVSNRPGEEWRNAENSLRIALSGIREMV